jgi:hypothetical protein
MAKVVIDMPDYMLNQIMQCYPFKLPSQFVTETYKIIRNGKILPKGHGKIGDLTKLYNKIDKRNRENGKGKYTGILVLVDNAETIIEADKE